MSLFRAEPIAIKRDLKMRRAYQYNHYVPVWYQKRFIPQSHAGNNLFYLDLLPTTRVDLSGVACRVSSERRRGCRQCFAEMDLYTRKLGAESSRAIEREFFGKIDEVGSRAVNFWANIDRDPGSDKSSFNDLLLYMSTQKLRTVKGLDCLALQFRKGDKAEVLSLMVEWQQVYCATWTECIWSIADASASETKFIISDHPVTVYNRRCPPKSAWCAGVNDPDIRWHATHTLFPLSLDKILILTNVSWLRNPYQSELGMRPNPRLFRNTIFNALQVQIKRRLNEEEVRQINFITKARALRYVAAAKQDWLYPERYIARHDWGTFGNGYLLMPDPREHSYGGEIFIQFRDGTSAGIDAYGRSREHPDFGKEDRTSDQLSRFKGEFQQLFGHGLRGHNCGDCF